ncbi:MAG: GNAT family N-acetyltransferase [Clostridia bacterium]|nr:GNAT family N-acetyltransferase [Clostridia bacterium]
MSDPIIYKGRGTPEMYDDLMDFMNYVFGFNGNDSDFKKLLPKLYRPECDPCYNNYVVTENGKLKAAIGAFDSVLKVGEEELTCRGIGNVAVHPYSRSKGYMKDCMKLALDGMIADGVDYSILGGIRQRYNHFGYETSGPAYRVEISARDLNYNFDRKGIPFVEFDLHTVTAADTELLDKMYAIHATRPLRTVRSREQFLDICNSWRSPAYAILKDGQFRGYFVGGLQELTLVDENDFVDVVRNYVRHHGKVSMHFAAWETDHMEKAAAIGSAPTMDYSDMYSIFNYKKVVSAFLRFKASYTDLADGEISVKINGFAKEEKLLIYVENGTPYVEEHSGDCDIELGHLEAAAFFFGLYSPAWTKVPAAARGWFPLPLYVDNADHV